MNLDEWGWERVASVSYVVVVSVGTCVVWCCCSTLRCLWQVTCGCLLGCMTPKWAWGAVAIAFAATYGFVFALWARSIPCFWLSCDGGQNDDIDLRDLLLWVGWPAASAAFLILFCFRGQVCGISRSGEHKRLEA